MKNFILKTISYIMGLVFIFCASAIDSYYNTPFIIGCIVSGLWLTLFGYANGVFDYD